MCTKLNVKIKKLQKDAIIPEYAKTGDAGLDLYTSRTAIIKPKTTVVIPTGVAMEIPRGYEMSIRPRSGISLRGCKVRVAESERLATVNVKLGTVDCGYRGEICIITENPNDFSIMIYGGTKLAQGVISPVAEANIEIVEELSSSDRAEGGFGSTGVTNEAVTVCDTRESYIKKQLDVFRKKNADYGDSVAKGLEIFGITSLLVRMSDKVNRLENLVRVKEAMVNDEAIEDTLDDLFNYTAMYIVAAEESEINATTMEDAMRFLLGDCTVAEIIYELILTEDKKTLGEIDAYFGLIMES